MFECLQNEKEISHRSHAAGPGNKLRERKSSEEVFKKLNKRNKFVEISTKP